MSSNGNRGEPRARLPLEGVRVLDLTIVWAGPQAVTMLSDWGAEVLRLESRYFFATATRGWRVHPSKQHVQDLKVWRFGYPDWDPGERPWNRFPNFQCHARNKLSITVDLLRPEGRDVLNELVKVSDVIIENNGPGVLDKLDISYEGLRRIRPDLIMVRMPAFGLDGPFADYRAFGFQMEGVAGHMSLWGYPELDLSSRDNTYVADAAGGIAGGLATVAALTRREKTGQGMLVEVSQTETMVPLLEEVVLDYQMTGRIRDAASNRERGPAQGCYPSKADDRWVVLTIATDEQWRTLCAEMGRPELVRDRRFRHSLARWRNQDQLDEIVGAWTVGFDHVEIMNRLQAVGVPAGAVLTEPDVYADPQLEARGFFEALPQADVGTIRYPGLLWQSERYPNRLETAPPLLGEHNEYAYRELLGLPDSAYDRFVEEGHIGMDFAPHLE